MPNEIASSQEQFHTVLRENMDNVGDVPVGGGSRTGLRQAPSMHGVELQTIYLDIQNITPDVQKRIDNVRTLSDISELVVNYGALVAHENPNQVFDVQFYIPVEATQRSLSPVVTEAKNYLRSIGFTTNEIHEMVATENATVYDLVPLVVLLQEARFADNPFMNCAVNAIGVEVSSLSRTAIEQAFVTSVEKGSGAVASAIAVGNFNHCLAVEMDVIVHAMLVSDEFEKMMEKQISFATMFLFEKLEGTQNLVDFESLETRDELMAWIGRNKNYTIFTSVAQADQLFSEIENQVVAMGDKFVSDRLVKDVELLENRAKYWAENPCIDDWAETYRFWNRLNCNLLAGGSGTFAGIGTAQQIANLALKGGKIGVKLGPKAGAIGVTAGLVVGGALSLLC